jgi:hypothetical protein
MPASCHRPLHKDWASENSRSKQVFFLHPRKDLVSVPQHSTQVFDLQLRHMGLVYGQYWKLVYGRQRSIQTQLQHKG